MRGEVSLHYLPIFSHSITLYNDTHPTLPYPPPPAPRHTHTHTLNFIILEKYFSSIAENESDSPKLMQKQGSFLFFLRFFPTPLPIPHSLLPLNFSLLLCLSITKEYYKSKCTFLGITWSTQCTIRTSSSILLLGRRSWKGNDTKQEDIPYAWWNK